ncbi:gamma-glutamyl-gamma-aminobutyrate hydrolase family protein [Candidatus Woesearchaeota archaeon]|nr:gamma-glutamyl-gamma-aminobutyrate hydrolase family protein [Candidatus Woesearchaeota archaeon]
MANHSPIKAKDKGYPIKTITKADMPILIIDHGSKLVNQFEHILETQGYNCSEVKNYKDLGDISGKDYAAVFLYGGNGKIRGNSDLNNELAILRYCINNKVPTMGINHGAQIICYYSGKGCNSGGLISRLENPRQGVFGDYVTKGKDSILKDVEGIITMEWHKWAIDHIGEDYNVLITDGLRKIQLAVHKEAPVYASQFHPEMKRSEGSLRTNGEIIFNNFLNIAYNAYQNAQRPLL